MSHVFGYTCGNEGSVRDWLRHSKFNVTQGKNFDRSGAIGPYLVTADEVGSAPLRVTTRGWLGRPHWGFPRWPLGRAQEVIDASIFRVASHGVTAES